MDMPSRNCIPPSLKKKTTFFFFPPTEKTKECFADRNSEPGFPVVG